MNDGMYIYWCKPIKYNNICIQRYAIQKSRIEPTSHRVQLGEPECRTILVISIKLNFSNPFQRVLAIKSI